MGRLITTSLITLAILMASIPVARGQEPTVSVAVVAQPIWHEAAGDPLGVSVLLTNSGDVPVDGYIVTVAAHGRVLSRSELHEGFGEPTTFEASRITAIDASDEEIVPGEAVRREIDQPVGALQSLAATAESGVYPITITVFDAGGSILGTTSTELIYYPTPPEFRLPAVPIVPIADLPRRDANGTFEPGPDGGFPLEDAIADDGWLSGLLDSLDETTTRPRAPAERTRGRGRVPEPADALHAAVVLMPRLAEELADMRDGYRRGDEDGRAGPNTVPAERARAVLAQIEEITERRWVQSMLAPYSFPDLPTLFHSFGERSPANGEVAAIPSDHVDQQLREAETVLAATIGNAPSRTWIYTPGARLNHSSLEELQRAQAARFTMFGEQTLEPIDDPAGGGCPEPPLSFTCHVEVETTIGRSSGYVLDDDLQQRLSDIARAGGSRISVQHFFAEIAMIREELPSRSDRVVAISLPGFWQPPQWVSRLLFDGLRRAPWLQTVTPKEGIALLDDQREPTARRIRSVTPRLANEPDPTYLAEIERADAAVESFRAVQPPSSLLQRLTRNTLVSESRLWWSDPLLLIQGEQYATDAADEAERELGKITIGGRNEVALTSRQAEVPVVVFNDASYEVSVNVNVQSFDLGLDESYPITVQANGIAQLTVDVVAQSSGIFPLFVTVETPDGHLIDRDEISVRSTEFNEIALGLTFGALAFLVLFYITRAVRGRRTSEAESGG